MIWNEENTQNKLYDQQQRPLQRQTTNHNAQERDTEREGWH